MSRQLILMYHSISHGPPPLAVAPDALRTQLELVRESGYRFSPLRALVADHREGRAGAEPVCSLTFDDGYRDFADDALPLLAESGATATLFVTAQADRRRLAAGLERPLVALDELAELERAGVEIGAHAVDHVDLRRLDDAGIERQVRDSAAILADHLESPPQSFAYPFGLHDDRVRRAVRSTYDCACTTRLDVVRAGDSPWTLPRVDAHYLASPVLRRLLRRRRPETYLAVRRLLRRLRRSLRSSP